MTEKQVPRPTPRHLRWQQAEFGMFCHFGINTFYGKEWSDGTLEPGGFAPSGLDAHQWVRVAQDAGMRYMILTAKHHDGFCLWPTATTDYSVAAAPFREGNGDVVREFTDACHEARMPCGLYLSPWDRHEPCYPDAAAYDDFYCRQMEELCTQYGDLFEIWLDGAGSEGRVYDWERVMGVVRRYQPEALVFNMGHPDIRWVGNEDGLAADPVRYVVSETAVSAFTDDSEQLADVTRRYLPPECDVAIRRNWFWQPDDLDTLKSTEHLLGIYYRSVGLGANLLLNVPPDRRGLISDEDSTRLAEMTGELRCRFASPVSGTIDANTISFPAGTMADHLVLSEDLTRGQRIDGFEIRATGSGRIVAAGESVGHKRIVVFPRRDVSTLTIAGEGVEHVSSVTAYDTGHDTLPRVRSRLDYAAWNEKADPP